MQLAGARRPPRTRRCAITQFDLSRLSRSFRISGLEERSGSGVVRPFKVACMQVMIRGIGSVHSKMEGINENLYRALSLVDYLSYRYGNQGSTKVIVFPEFFMQGIDHNRTLEEHIAVSITIPGRETDELSKAAQAYGLYIAGGALEFDPKLPNRFFNSAFLIGPSGDVALRYRQIQPHGGISLFSSPADCYSEYLDTYGVEGLFPVVDTPYGTLACIIGYDHVQPEYVRCLAMRGAELILEVAGEPYMEQATGYQVTRQARAVENVCYVAIANHGIFASPVGDRFSDSPAPLFQERTHQEVAPMFRTPGKSQVIDFEGRILAMIDGPGEATVQATIDMNALRFKRSEIGMNYFIQLRTQVVADFYRRVEMYPVDAFARHPVQQKREFVRLHEQVIQRLQANGVFKPPPS